MRKTLLFLTLVGSCVTSFAQSAETKLPTAEETNGNNTTAGVAIVCLTLLLAVAVGALVYIRQRLLTQIGKMEQDMENLKTADSQKTTLLTGLNDRIEPLMDAVDEVNAGVFSEVLRVNTAALKRFMNDIRAYNELMKSCDERYPLKDYNIQALCERIMEKAKGDFRLGVESVVEVPLIQVKTNEEALERILLHLLKNAAYHTAKGKITLSFKKRSAHTLQFIVTDTGVGIAPEEHEHLFTPFAAMCDLTVEDRMGLPICNQVAYKLNGALSIDENYKKGARLILEVHV